MKTMITRGLLLVILYTVVCGLLYPALITGVAQVFFPQKANGSIITVDGKQYGSALLAQEFTGEQYLWGRMMQLDTATFTDDQGRPLLYATPSNLSPASPAYAQLIAERVAKMQAAHPEKAGVPIPGDLVTVSGSGLDPHISPAAAQYQVERIAHARGMTPAAVEAVIQRYTQGRFLGLFGEPRVNVLEVNLALEGILAPEATA